MGFPLAFLLLEAEPANRLQFQVWPETIQTSKSARYNEYEIPGRSEPYQLYGSSSPRTFNLTLPFVASVSQEDDTNGEAEAVVSLLGHAESTFVGTAVNWLNSLVYPRTVPVESPGLSDLVYPPHTVFLVLGTYICARCVVRDVQTTHPNETTWGSTFHSPNYVLVSLVLSEVNKKAPSYSDFRGPGKYGFNLGVGSLADAVVPVIV